MNPSVATAICFCGIAGLFYLDRERNDRTSHALWLPVVWIAVVASRPVSQWFGVQGPGNLGLDGSPVDAAVLGILLVMGMGVLIQRPGRARTLLVANWPILIYFLYCLISLAWSSHADVSFKRWAKAIGDLAMALIIATDRAPVDALRRVASRLGMILFPASILMIHYYGDFGRGYTSDGLAMNTGVTDNKNALGLIVLVISLMVLWNVRSLLIHKNEPNRGRHLAAQGIVLAFGLDLFWLANCSTCKACFALGGLLVFALNLRAFKGRLVRVHALCLTMLVAAIAILLLGGQGGVANALGRESSFSGRTEIWAAVIPAVPNSIIGAGFESFWNSANADRARDTLIRNGFSPLVIRGLNEAHDGYIEIYLQLGWTGICLIGFVIFSGYRRACKAYRRNPEFGSLLIAYVASATIYSISEAGFRTLNPSWIFLLTAVVLATAVSAGFVGGEKPRISASRRDSLKGTGVLDELEQESLAVSAVRPRWNAI